MAWGMDKHEIGLFITSSFCDFFYMVDVDVVALPMKQVLFAYGTLPLLAFRYRIEL